MSSSVEYTRGLGEVGASETGRVSSANLPTRADARRSKRTWCGCGCAAAFPEWDGRLALRQRSHGIVARAPGNVDRCRRASRRLMLVREDGELDALRAIRVVCVVVECGQKRCWAAARERLGLGSRRRCRRGRSGRHGSEDLKLIWRIDRMQLKGTRNTRWFLSFMGSRGPRSYTKDPQPGYGKSPIHIMSSACVRRLSQRLYRHSSTLADDHAATRTVDGALGQTGRYAKEIA